MKSFRKNQQKLDIYAMTDPNSCQNGKTYDLDRYSEPRVVRHNRIYPKVSAKDPCGTMPIRNSYPPVSTELKPMRKSCIPLCNIESSSGASSHANYTWKEPSPCTIVSEYPSSQYDHKSELLNRDDNRIKIDIHSGDTGLPPYFAIKDNQAHSEWSSYSPVSRLRCTNENLSLLHRFHSINTSFESTDRNSVYDPSDLANTIEESIIDESCIQNDGTINAVGGIPRNRSRPDVATRHVVVTRPKRRSKNYYRRKRANKIRKLKTRTITENPSLISDNLFIAMVSTLFCFLPLGIVALYYTWKVQKSLSENKIDDARLYSLKGRKFANTGIMMGITGLALVVLILLVKDNVPYSSLEYDYYLPDVAV
ncbi:uncharacterized protein LOC120347267 [Styela clava]